MSFDVASFRAGFPSLACGIAHFDNPGGTQTPAVVGEAIARTLTGPLSQRGGLLDGPVYRSIFQNLRGIHLHEPDEYAPFNTGHVVFHDDFGDYSTNEPIMDGTGMLTYLLVALAP